MVQCDHCAQYWHLDCLDPPLANPPALNQNGKKAYDWMCPLHADHEMRHMPMWRFTREIHARKPKRPRIVETALSRGHRNNGIIEVLDDTSDVDEAEFFDQAEEGIVYKLPASGIILDFIDKINSTKVSKLRDAYVYDKRDRLAMLPRPPLTLEKDNFAKRSIHEQQVALNLAQFATSNADLNLGADQVQNLLGTLIAEAPSEVVDRIMLERQARACVTPPPQASGKSTALPAESVVPTTEAGASIAGAVDLTAEANALSAEERNQLQKLQELIRRKLEGSSA